MKVYYFNDRRVKMTVRYDSVTGQIEESLEPHKGKEFSVFVPRGHCLFVKEWDYSVVLLSSMEREKNEDGSFGN